MFIELCFHPSPRLFLLINYCFIINILPGIKTNQKFCLPALWFIHDVQESSENEPGTLGNLVPAATDFRWMLHIRDLE